MKITLRLNIIKSNLLSISAYKLSHFLLLTLMNSIFFHLFLFLFLFNMHSFLSLFFFILKLDKVLIWYDWLSAKSTVSNWIAVVILLKAFWWKNIFSSLSGTLFVSGIVFHLKLRHTIFSKSVDFLLQFPSFILCSFCWYQINGMF